MYYYDGSVAKIPIISINYYTFLPPSRLNKLENIYIIQKQPPFCYIRMAITIFGGELGIRTLGTFLYTTFRVSHLRPLGQLSVYFLNCSFLVRKRFGENYRREQEKIFDFNVLKPRWIKGFVRTKPPKLQRISSAAPSTTQTTLHYIILPRRCLIIVKITGDVNTWLHRWKIIVS